MDRTRGRRHPLDPRIGRDLSPGSGLRHADSLKRRPRMPRGRALLKSQKRNALGKLRQICDSRCIQLHITQESRIVAAADETETGGVSQAWRSRKPRPRSVPRAWPSLVRGCRRRGTATRPGWVFERPSLDEPMSENYRKTYA